MWHSFGNDLLRLYLFVLVNVFSSIQQIFIEHYCQTLGDIKRNKAWFLYSQSWSPCRLFYKCYYVGMCLVLLLCVSPQPGCRLLESKGLLWIILMFSTCAVSRQGVPQDDRIPRHICPTHLPSWPESPHMAFLFPRKPGLPAQGSKVERGVLRKSPPFSQHQERIECLYVIFYFLC